MSHGGEENQGTGLRDVFGIIVKAPPERLLSLTFQLGESPEDNIIHALCLIILQREAQALNKLQMLRDNNLAEHLAEKWQMSGGKLEDFAIQCGHFREVTGETLAALARIFRVLSEKKLCDPFLRNLAYKRALSSDDRKTNNCEDDQLREEAKVVCGPQFVEWMSSPTDLKTGSYRDLSSCPNEGTTTLKVTLSQNQSEGAHSLPSPLQATSPVPSYPTHLEISTPPTASFQDDKRTPETSDKSKLNTPVLLVSEFEAKNAPGEAQTSEKPQSLKSTEPPTSGAQKHPRMDEVSSKLDCDIAPTQITKPTTETKSALPTATNIFLSKMPVTNETHQSNSAVEEEEEEEEEIFYAFVILHAPEDADMAESMREKLETVIGSAGATFSEDFATPGKSTLRCVEDAINNTAFTLLLLTRNFSTRMQEIETNSALINSVNKKHKYNTVIPLLPRENRMSKEDIPLVLMTLVPLEENNSFERKIKKSLSPARIKAQEKIWKEEQTVKMQRKRQERLKHSNQHQRQMLKEYATVQSLETENIRLLMTQKLLLGHNVPPEQVGGDTRAFWPHPANIHIENAKYIMIGNDSQMTVGGGVDISEEEQ